MNQSTTQINKGKGGKREGAGRKKGVKTLAVLEREAVLKAFRERAMRTADQLLSAQISVAKGQAFLFKKSISDKRPTLVTNEEEIARYLDKVEGTESTMIDGIYYYITIKEPENAAIDSILDRTFGKATQNIEMGGTIRVGKLEEIQKATKDILK